MSLHPKAAVLAAGLVAALGTGVVGDAAMARDLTVVSWGGTYQDAQRKVYFEPFKQQSGLPLVEDSWDGGIGTLRAKVEGGAVPWDVVQAEAEELSIGCDEGLLVPIDWAALGGRDKFLPSAVSDCGVGAIVWSTVLAYDAAKFPEAGPKSWTDFWDVKTFPGKRGMRKGPKYTLEFALLADGVAPKDVYGVLATREGVDRAFAKLDQLKPSIIWWEAGAQPPQLLASGEVTMTSVYNGRLDAPRKEGKDFRIVWPGSIYAVDSWVILSGSPKVEDGMKLIAFMSDAERQAKLPDFISYGVTNAAAMAQIPPEQLANLPSAPQNLDVSLPINVRFWTDHIDELNKRFTAWAAQ